MKILTCCAGGNVRSVTMAYCLKSGYGHDVLACGLEYNSESTLRMLFAWADLIIVMHDVLVPLIPVKYEVKAVLFDVGPDKWGIALHPELIEICLNGIESFIKNYLEPVRI